MYSRLRDGLLSPSSIIDYIKDKWYKPFFQLLLYALILTIPVIVSVLTYDGLSYDQKLEIRQTFNNENIPFEIVDGTLVSSQNEDAVYEKDISEVLKFQITVNEIENEDLTDIYLIAFTKDKVVLRLAGMEMDILIYNEVESLKNFDLSKLGKYDNVTEWDIIFSTCDNIVKSYLSVATISLGIMTFFQNAFVLAILALIVSFSFLVRFSKLLKYSAMYKMSIYYLAPFVIGNLLANLIGAGIFYYVGFILSIIYSVVGSNVIISRLMNQGRK